MPVVAVINRKGGSGKSTLATHLAGFCAASGRSTMLGDVDRQQSSLAWLRRRAEHAGVAEVAGWAGDGRSVLRPPAGVTHVVIDTPGGLREGDLARIVMYADAILMPVCQSAFDRESAAACHAELLTLPRVASGRCKVGVVGMRLDARTKAAEQMLAWADELGVDYVGALRETQGYVRCAEQGLTIFDMPPAKVAADLEQWQPVIKWLHAAWAAAARHGQPLPAMRPPLGAAPRARPAAVVPAVAVAPDAAPRVAPAPAPIAVVARRAQAAPIELPRRPPQGAPRSARAGRFGWLLSVFKLTD